MTADTPRWAVFAAHAVPLCVLPSSVWRLSAGGWYPVLLSCVATGLSLLTLGLVHSWGDRFPARLVVVTALTGAALLAGLCLYYFLNHAFGWVPRGPVLVGADDGPRTPPTGWAAATYAPLVLWPPLLAAVTIAYRRRRVGGRMGVR